jgi:hypothetical protein
MKCETCYKKLNSMYKIIHTCKCNGIYCTKHILAHTCSYNYKSDIIKLEKIIAPKIQKI